MIRFRLKCSKFTGERLKLQHVQISDFLFVCFELGSTWLIKICLSDVQKDILSCFTAFISMIAGFRSSHTFSSDIIHMMWQPDPTVEIGMQMLQ